MASNLVAIRCGPGAGAGDPLAALRARQGLAPLVDGFSVLAIVTSYIGFVLGLTDFLSDLFQVTFIALLRWVPDVQSH